LPEYDEKKVVHEVMEPVGSLSPLASRVYLLGFGLGLFVSRRGTISATVPPGARNLIGTTPGSPMISQPNFFKSAADLAISSTSMAK
jgi:hypothetical protein